MLDALGNYEVEGVQLDDHFVFPNGFDKTEDLSNEEKTQVCTWFFFFFHSMGV